MTKANFISFFAIASWFES